MEVIHEEEVSFNLTLKKGIKKFNSEAERMFKENIKIFPGDMAFFLYGTMGFPTDLTELMAEEKGVLLSFVFYILSLIKLFYFCLLIYLGFTLDKEGFYAAMEADKEMARLANKSNYAGRELILEAAQTVYLKEMGVKPTDDSDKYNTNTDHTTIIKAIYTAKGFVNEVTPSDEVSFLYHF